MGSFWAGGDCGDCGVAGVDELGDGVCCGMYSGGEERIGMGVGSICGTVPGLETIDDRSKSWTSIGFCASEKRAESKSNPCTDIASYGGGENIIICAYMSKKKKTVLKFWKIAFI